MKNCARLLLIVFLLIALMAAAMGCKPTPEQIRINFFVNETLFDSVEYNDEIEIELPEEPINSGYFFNGWFLDNETCLIEFTADWLKSNPPQKSINIYAHLINESDLDLEPTLGLRFELINDGTEYEVFKGTATDTKIIIPSTYNDLPVTRIGSGAFSYFEELTYVKIPSIISYKSTEYSVVTISQYAFYNCLLLKSVVIPSSVNKIELYAFGNCDLISVTIPSSVKNVEVRAFEYNYSSTFYLESTTDGWHHNWNADNHPVILNCTLSKNHEYVVSIVKNEKNLINKNYGVINAPTREGYKFKGWSKKSNSTKVDYAAQDIYKAPENAKLYAIWIK